jgi:S-DNA-T family DNA segregation ATPase FtsK/SpoIIIE
MNKRYRLMSEGFNVKNFSDTVIIIDEFSDLILQDQNKLFYKNLCTLSQKCRAAKIHIILSTQRPSNQIIDGSIKANFPARISCKVASHIDSKVILDSVGAESLMGGGDAFIKDSFRSMERFQIAYTDAEINLKWNAI